MNKGSYPIISLSRVEYYDIVIRKSTTWHRDSYSLYFNGYKLDIMGGCSDNPSYTYNLSNKIYFFKRNIERALSKLIPYYCRILTRHNTKPNWKYLHIGCFDAGPYRISRISIGLWDFYLSYDGFCHHDYKTYSYTSTKKKEYCRHCRDIKWTNTETI